MSAQIKPRLSDGERAKIRKKVFLAHKKNPITVLEAMNESHAWHKLYMDGDSIHMTREMDLIVSGYLERCGLYEEAEQEELAAIERGGR